MINRTFHFAIKPGEEPVQLPNLSAHSKMPWVARGYEVFKFVGRLDVTSEGAPILILRDVTLRFVLLQKKMGWRYPVEMRPKIEHCMVKSVAKSVAKTGISPDDILVQIT